MRAKLPSVDTFFPWNSLFFLTPDASLDIYLRYQMLRIDTRSFYRVNSCLWAMNSPWQNRSTICAPLNKPGPTGCHHPSHGCADLSKINSPHFPLKMVDWNMALSMKDLKNGLCWPRKGMFSWMETGKIFFLSQEQLWKITPLSQCRGADWSVSFPCLK